MKFVGFTDLEGNPVLINSESVTMLRVADKGNYAAGAKTVIVMGGDVQAVTAPLAEVERLLTS